MGMGTVTTGSTGSAPAARPPMPREPDFLAPIDLDAHLALLPSGAACKGLFLADLMRLVPRNRTVAEVHHLAGVPERRYIAFRDYPMAENMRLTIAMARSAFPGLPLGQAMRRLGQAAFDTVMGCHIGKTLFGVLGKDLERLLLHWPKSYELFFGFGHITMQRSGPGIYAMHARQFPVFLETYQVGVLEGALRHCGATGRVRIAMTSLAEAVLEVDLV
ncbi:serine/threonine protein kinase [Minicystis rosea]|nr:serine/threonine protein kinase [Minicystis rosea]